ARSDTPGDINFDCAAAGRQDPEVQPPDILGALGVERSLECVPSGREESWCAPVHLCELILVLLDRCRRSDDLRRKVAGADGQLCEQRVIVSCEDAEVLTN